jgi:N-acetylated-alpha-linked acidic dipeptidase
VTDPEKNVSVLERLRAHDLVDLTSEEQRKEYRERELIRLDALGSGSDWTPFLQHTGIASLSIGYGGESGGGSYHSIYDSFDHYTRFVDPTFDYGVTQAKTNGRLVLRLANADVLPFEFTTFADTLKRYLDELTRLADRARAETEERNRLVRDKVYDLADDPTRPLVAPKMQEPVPYFNFAPLQNAVAKVQRSAREYARVASALPQDPARQVELDRALMHVEQALLTTQGLPRRPWFRHQIYAPGFYTGYGVKTVPGVREAIEQKEWAEVASQMDVVARTLEAYAAEVDRATAIARGR